MRILLFLIAFTCSFSQLVIKNFSGGKFKFEAKQTFDYQQMVGLNLLSFETGSTSIEQIYTVPSRMAFIDKPSFTLNLPIEQTYEVASLFPLKAEFNKKQDQFFETFTIEDPEQFRNASLEFNSSISFRIPDFAGYYPIPELPLGVFAAHKVVQKSNIDVTNRNTNFTLNYTDSDPDKSFDFVTRNMNSLSSIKSRLALYTLGMVYKISGESSFSFATNLVHAIAEVRSTNVFDSYIYIPNDDLEVEFNNAAVGYPNLLESRYKFDLNEMKPQFALYFTYQPSQFDAKEYKSNAMIELVVKSAVEYELNNVKFGTDYLPNFISDFKVISSLVDKDEGTLHRTKEYFIDRGTIYIPGFMSASFQYPYGNHRYGLQLLAPVGKFGIAYTEKRVETWTDKSVSEDRFNATSETRIKNNYYIMPNFGFTLSYAYVFTEFYNLRLNTHVSAMMAQINYNQKFETINDERKQMFLPSFGLNLSFNINENIVLSTRLAFPEATIIKNSISYIF